MTGCHVPGPLRVAAYCRVSTDKEDQRGSLAAQRAFFLSYIQRHPDWNLVEVFADEGLSGTSAKGRPQFTRMLRQAMAGGLDLIVTKEVSRFARNTVDALQITRRLKERGVGVCFLNDGIDTRDSDGEFRLTIMASVAQEESRKISERTRWGQLQAMRRGVAFGNSSIYGYTLQKGSLTVEPRQAAVVREIYQKVLLEGKGSHVIARELTQAGVPPPLGGQGGWSPATVLRVLRNEKYCGDLLQKKYRTLDHLSHRKIPNDGGEEQFCLEGHHEAIVSRQDFQAVQAELERRSRLGAAGGRFSSKHWYSGKIKCGACGGTFVCKRAKRSGGGAYTRFVCRGRLEGAEGCPMRAVRGEILLGSVGYVLNALALDRGGITEGVLAELEGEGWNGREAEAERRQLRQGLRRLEDRRKRGVEAYLEGTLSQEELKGLEGQCREEAGKLQARLKAAEEERGDIRNDPAVLALLRRELEGGEALMDELVERITVWEDCLAVQLNGLPLQFYVWAEGRGRGEGYHVEVTACAAVPAKEN